MAGEKIDVEYNQNLKPLEALLSRVNRPGDFFVHGTAEIPLPRVEISEVGTLSFPVPPEQIAALIRQAQRAPYGRGEETILDESVRKVWQIPAERVQIGGRSWAASFEEIMNRVAAGLGCETATVSAELYKLLIYDPGGFFLAHRDTEKTDGMFATLVLVLPSEHQGGELVIRHAGREATVDLHSTEVSEVAFAAFYADCEHEVRPITAGHRVCLVFNLIQKPKRKTPAARLQAPAYEQEIARAAALLEKELAAPEGATKIAWLLEHQYSPAGLSLSALKSPDVARVQVLVQAAERAGCAAHLGIVHIEESGAAQPVFDGYSRRRRRYWDDDEKEDEDSGSDDDFEVIEVFDRHHFVSEWRDLQDQPVEFGQLPIQPGELLPAGALDGEKPDQQRMTEASGNEGATFERSYHRAALVLWRRDQYSEVLLQSGVSAVLPYLKQRIAEALAPRAPAIARTQAVALAQRLIEVWTEPAGFSPYRRASQPEGRDRLLQLLVELEEPALVEDFISQVILEQYDGSENTALRAAANLLEPTTATRLFSDLLRRYLPTLPGLTIDLLARLASVRPRSAPWLAAWRQVAAVAVGALKEVRGKPKRDDWGEWGSWPGRSETASVDAKVVEKFLTVLGKLNAPELRLAAVKTIAAQPEVFDPVTILTPALAALQEWDDAIGDLWRHTTEFLLRRSSHPPEAPTDWRQDVQLSCKCDDCRELQAFALNPVEQVHRFRVRQDRRMHLHQAINRHRLAMTHVTERKGSPQTLVCTKDLRDYQQRCTQYQTDITALADLVAVIEKANAKGSATEEILGEISAARKRAANWKPTTTEPSVRSS